MALIEQWDVPWHTPPILFVSPVLRLPAAFDLGVIGIDLDLYPIGTSLNNYRNRLTEIMDSVDNLMIHFKHLE